MSEVSLSVEVREAGGKGVARKMRAQGRAPAILYGHGKDPVKLSFRPDVLEKLIKASHAGLNTLIDLKGAQAIEGRTVIVKDLQRDPVRGGMLHADFFEVDVNARITVSVPVHIVGIAIGVSLEGGLMDHSLREIELDCLPGAIPDSIDADVSALDLGGSLHVRDLPLPGGVELRSDGDLSVVSIVAPTVAEEETPEAEDELGVEGEAAPAEGEDAAEAAPEGEKSDRE